MTKPARPVHFLMAEDDPEDQVLVRDAFKEARVANRLDIVANGEELLDFLKKRGAHTRARRPDIILMDLNMPRMDGREALKTIKADPALKAIPVIILTTSGAEEDIVNSYELGVSSYVCKPVTFDALVDVMKLLGSYWIEIVELPANQNHTAAASPNRK